MIALLDWELSTLGDPLADLSYFLMSWVTEPEGRSGVKGQTGAATGIPTMGAMVDRYCAATGRDGLPDLDWYFSYNLFPADRHRPGHQEANRRGHRVERAGGEVSGDGSPAGQSGLGVRGEGGGGVTMRFEGKSIIVTGAGSGIGRAAALLFAAEGGRVVAADLTDGADETARLITAASGVAAAIRIDAGCEEDVVARRVAGVRTVRRRST